MKIKVLKLDGSHPTIGAYLMRWIFRVFDRGLIALITIAVNNKGQRLGDIAAGTTVVKLRNPVSLEDLVTEKTDINYVLTFPEASLLSDKDIVTLRAVVRKYEREGNEDLLEQAALKVKSVTNISTELDDLTFLNKILQDHTHLMTAE
ncbi:RDD family protein [Pseudarcicella hirudinis]